MKVFVALVVAGPDTEIVGVFADRDLATAAAHVGCDGRGGEGGEGRAEPLVQEWEVE